MIDNLFIDISEMENNTICPLLNSLSDHNAQLTTISIIDLQLQFLFLSVVGPLLILLYVNDLLTIKNNKSKTILFADDTSLIVTNPNSKDFKKLYFYSSWTHKYMVEGQFTIFKF